MSYDEIRAGNMIFIFISLFIMIMIMIIKIITMSKLYWQNVFYISLIYHFVRINNEPNFVPLSIIIIARVPIAIIVINDLMFITIIIG